MGDEGDHPALPQATPPAQRTSAAGPLPWKWLVGAALLMVAAIAISRGINARVASEESGTSALIGGTSGSGGLVDLNPLPAVPAESSEARPVETVPNGSAPRDSPANRPRSPSSRVGRSPAQADRPSLPPAVPVDSAARDTSAATNVARDGVRRDLVRRDSAGRDSVRREAGVRDTAASIAPIGARRDSAAPPPLTAREIEIQAIRAELARRTARLDSMGRAMGTLYVAPRRPPPEVPPGPTASPPSPRDQRD